MKRILALALLVSVQALAQSGGWLPFYKANRTPGGGTSCDGPPFYTDLSALTTGNLDGQAGWVDKSGAGNYFQVVNGSGVYGAEATWSTVECAIDTGNCQTTDQDQWVAFIFKQGSGTPGGGSSYGIAGRCNAAGDSMIWLGYDKSSGLYLGSQLGSSWSQYTWTSVTLSDGDSVTMVLNGTAITVYQNSTSRISYSDAGVFNSGTARYMGLMSIGDESPTWYILRWRGGDP